MTVYVDDMYRHEIGRLGRMKMSHLIADTTDELLAMVRAIGVNPKWIQHAGTRDEHFDIAISKRAAAIAAGAVPITYRECGAMNKRRRVTGALGAPADAVEWLERFIAARRESRGAAPTPDEKSEEMS
ncbi:DUF4031 domain-containing protein [Burkholderia cenocepacia]|uniref:DUF4031 domain-containing protein n=1 Tax=Burkholderia cenocepacia TaxID=95486 RepID=A0A1V2W384_9BURK|nr:DUF4031 domain-containing protein [Burkholderia cenocepacia]MBR8248635.1 DUF4031 domain-containing protein [Burkholderia cenocepacia]MBR8288809.1 DUF4031 domain-containing protein [Burkholderia cenocepacia]MBR8498561.1 DUF4031 domain-containing protein [Burkholderia cenocepacia]ONJ13653.1 hypothetical protein A8D83_11830 [Burkholderia cenocepacia]ONJ30243.1 hypothetical protein A8D90_07380 [Burkholderia cenocepacia]